MVEATLVRSWRDGSAPVLRQSVIVAALVTMAAAPRQLARATSADPWLMLAGLGFQFLLVVLLADAPAAWGRSAGMAGLWPAPRALALGVAGALGAALALAPLHALVDPELRAALLEAGRADLVALHLPTGRVAVTAAMLWSGGFEALFFYGFAMSVLARAFGRVDVAVVGAVALRTLVSALAMSSVGILDVGLLPLAVGALTSLAAALLFARGGLPAAALLAMLVKARLLL